MSWIAAGVAVGSIAAGAIGKGAGKKKEARHVKKMPKYKINQEAFDNQNIAKSRAFGRDRSIQTAQEDVDQNASNSVSAAKDVTSSTSGLLSAIASINASGTQAKRGLAQDEAQIQRANVGDLYQANDAMIDEKDKAWRQNKFAPWDAKMRAIRENRANNNAFWTSVTGAGIGAAGGISGKKGGGS